LLAIESRKFLAGQPHDDQVGIALFTLAIVHKNQEAWTCLYNQYRPLVLTWVMQRPEATQLIAYDGDASGGPSWRSCTATLNACFCTRSTSSA
jgi:hypothetical protein